MNLGIISISSSSSGNSYIVKSDSTTLILDVGIAGKKIKNVISECGIAPETVAGILLTHEHSDHVKSIRLIAKTYSSAEVIASHGTMTNCKNIEHVSDEQKHTLSANEEIMIGDIKVRAFKLSHDASEPIGYSFIKNNTQITVVTDTGIITDEIFEELKKADVLVLEANHEVNILKCGDYPYYLKRRILGEEGHLSNVTAGETLCRMLDTREKKTVPKIMLGHLSSENNTPMQAELTIKNILEEHEYFVGKDIEIDVAAKSTVSDLIGY